MQKDVQNLKFNFPDTWQVSQYDELVFYRKKFSTMCNKIKAVDLIALENQVVWLIEVKDYRQHPRTKTIDLAEEVIQKVVATLAAMLPAKIHASIEEEKKFASRVLRAASLRVVLHLEQPVTHSKLFPRAIDPAKLQLKLRNRIKSIDPHPKVVEASGMQNLAWTVT